MMVSCVVKNQSSRASLSSQSTSNSKWVILRVFKPTKKKLGGEKDAHSILITMAYIEHVDD
jgi:hypothetical protein